MLIMIDNYDSFTYNLVQYFGELGQEVTVYRNDQITVDQVGALSPDFVVISPGPCTPNEAGISVDLVVRYAGMFPILGVCLGHPEYRPGIRRKHCPCTTDHARKNLHGAS